MCDRRERITVEHFFKYCQKLRSIIQNIYANVWGFLGHNGEDPIIMAALLIIFSHSCWQVVWCLCHGSYLSISQHSRVKLSVLRLWNDYDLNRSWWKKFELPSRRDSTFGLNCICMCIYGFGFRKILNNQKYFFGCDPPEYIFLTSLQIGRDLNKLNQDQDPQNVFF